jgi:RNA polymerase sigma-70 factor (ECF subfamily)
LTVLKTVVTSCDEGALPEAALVVVSDHHLMLAVAAGDADAYAVLLQRHLKGMVALAQRIMGNRADADEVAQEAFLRLWTHALRWDAGGKAQVKTWLSRVVTNLCLDRWRKKPMLPLEAAEEVVDDALDGFSIVHDGEKRNILQKCLQRLPVKQRTAIVLSYYEELSGHEIANVMGISSGAVESLLVRARKALRRDLAAQQVMQRGDL